MWFVFFHLTAMFFQRKHLSVSLSPLPFLTMTEPVTVGLKSSLLHSLMQVSGTGKSYLKFKNGDEERQT